MTPIFTISQALKHFLPDLHHAIELCDQPDNPEPEWPTLRDWCLVILSFLAGVFFTLLLQS